MNLMVLIVILSQGWSLFHSQQNVEFFFYVKDAKISGGKYINIKIENKNTYPVHIICTFKLKEEKVPKAMSLDLDGLSEHIQFLFFSMKDSVHLPAIEQLQINGINFD